MSYRLFLVAAQPESVEGRTVRPELVEEYLNENPDWEIEAVQGMEAPLRKRETPSDAAVCYCALFVLKEKYDKADDE